MTRLVECIPNFSEARRPEVIDRIVAAISAVEGVHLLDRSSDLDHNRTVLTFAGPPETTAEAAFQAIKTAAELIDLDRHTGEHPRIGATDVCPFVPLSGVTMDDCVALARRLGQRVGEELGIPVYLYEAAATRPERVNLEDVRRGQYEALKQEMGVDPARDPDFGPRKVGPAGATVIGARDFLIAYNVYLTTDDVEIARKVARAVRHSSGGLRYVKALGLLVDSCAQVSMNLTNFHQTPLARVVEFIRREAARYGVAIHHSELVGLIPQEALVDAAVWYTQLDQFEKEQVLETRLLAASSASRPVAAPSFLDELAAPTPTPGGGSAAAFAAAMGAGLVSMVAGVTVGKKAYAQVEAEMGALRDQAEALRAELEERVREDAAAFEALMEAYRMPKKTKKQESARQTAIQRATLNAAQVPLQVAGGAVQVMELARRAAEIGNVNAISDAASAAAMAQAGLTAAGYNVRINVAALQDQKAGKKLLDQVKKLEAQAGELFDGIRTLMRNRAGLVD
jgi:glutamate formiminotransferase/formiminotetrahydrofolate cyclodeaminase